MKKQDFIEYKEQNNLTLTEFAQKIGISANTLWLFLNTNTTRKRKVMFKLKQFHAEYIEKNSVVEETEPTLFDEPKVEEIQEEITCSAYGNFREFRLSLEVSLQTMKNEGVITQESFDNLMFYVSQMNNAYEDVAGDNKCRH